MAARATQTEKKTPSMEVRRALLDLLSLPAGQATVERARGNVQDQLLVRLSPGAHPAQSPQTFCGFPVLYENLSRATTRW